MKPTFSDWPFFKWEELELDPTGEKDLPPCPCCGNPTRRVWGYVNQHGITYAVYSVSWTPNVPQHGARFEMILGNWGEGPTADDRAVASIEYWTTEGMPLGFTVVDAEPKESELAKHFLLRSDIIGTPLAPKLFALLDAVFAKETRIEEIREW